MEEELEMKRQLEEMKRRELEEELERKRKAVLSLLDISPRYFDVMLSLF